ncbi:MAG: thioredoxin family protein [Planctomycetaceae bacterium]|nr:thioredoxin family protein [Planctomycetaceae bacterium]
MKNDRAGLKLIVLALVIGGAGLAYRGCNRPGPQGASSNLPWLEDFEAAKAAAAASGKPMLVDFTGSDWCGWCIKLDNEVFSKPAFEAYARENLILVKLDFPKRKELPAAIKSQNESLSRQYGVRGFPTILLVSPDGGVIARTGYRPGGAESYVEHLKTLLSKRS